MCLFVLDASGLRKDMILANREDKVGAQAARKSVLFVSNFDVLAL